jgi:formate C-acetyltransferase
MFEISYNSASSHIPMGTVVGATPDGRKAWTPLADNISPTNGTDVSGPTAVFKSISKISNISQSMLLLNMRFSPTAMEGENLDKLISMLKSYWDLGGYHVQLNCVTQETLLAAQKNPEKYRDLLVRVGGFSAYFCVLSKEIQDNIISRMVYQL